MTTHRVWIALITLSMLTAPWTAQAAADPLAELRKGLTATDTNQQAEAVAKAGELGPFAATLTPELIKLLSTNDLALKVEVIAALGEIGEGAAASVPQLRPLTQDKEILVRHAAWTALKRMAPASRAAAAELDRGLADPELIVRLAAAEAALKMDPGIGPQYAVKAVAVLADGLKSDSAHCCRESAQALVSAGPLGVPALVESVKAAKAAALVASLESLALLGSDAALAIPAVLALKPANDTVAAAQARTLAAIAPDAKTVIPVLSGLAGHATPSVRAASISALGMYPAAADMTVPLLIKSLQDKEVSVRLAAVGAIAAHGPAAKAAVPALDAALADANGAVTIRAAEALAMIGSAAVPALVKRIDDPAYGELALQTLGQMGPDAASATPKLVEKLAQPGKLSVREICLALAFTKADPKVAGPALQKIAQDAKSSARAPAIFALGRIGDRTAIKLITNLVEEDDPVVRLASAWALLQFDPKDPEYIKIAVPRLQFGLERPDPRVRIMAAETLAQIGPAAAAAVPALTKRVGEDQDPLVRANCALALAQMGDASRTAVPALVQMLENEPAGGRRAIFFALGTLGPVAIDALPNLRKEALQGPLFDRTLAAWAVLKIRADQQEINQMVPLLMQRLTREEPEAAVQLIQLLGDLGHGRPEIVKFLEPLRQAPVASVREAAEAAYKKATAK